MADSKLLGPASVGTSEVGLQEQLELSAKASISPGKRSVWSVEEMPSPTHKQENSSTFSFHPHFPDEIAYSLEVVSMMLLQWALLQMGLRYRQKWMSGSHRLLNHLKFAECVCHSYRSQGSGRGAGGKWRADEHVCGGDLSCFHYLDRWSVVSWIV